MKRRDLILFIGIIVASIIGTNGFAETNTTEEATTEKIGTKEIERIISKIKGNPDFSMFYKAIDQAGLAEEIADLNEMTLLIPTNKAFKLLTEDVWENFLDPENKDALIQLLSYHIIPKKVGQKDLESNSELSSLQGEFVKVFNNGHTEIENAAVSQKHDETKKVIIYKLDGVIMPLK